MFTFLICGGKLTTKFWMSNVICTSGFVAASPDDIRGKYLKRKLRYNKFIHLLNTNDLYKNNDGKLKTKQSVWKLTMHKQKKKKNTDSLYRSCL